ncbi:hypothetical protein ACJX0J_013741, partial [Zea mays]
SLLHHIENQAVQVIKSIGWQEYPIYAKRNIPEKTGQSTKLIEITAGHGNAGNAHARWGWHTPAITGLLVNSRSIFVIPGIYSIFVIPGIYSIFVIPGIYVTSFFTSSISYTHYWHAKMIVYSNLLIEGGPISVGSQKSHTFELSYILHSNRGV